MAKARRRHVRTVKQSRVRLTSCHKLSGRGAENGEVAALRKPKMVLQTRYDLSPEITRRPRERPCEVSPFVAALVSFVKPQDDVCCPFMLSAFDSPLKRPIEQRYIVPGTHVLVLLSPHDTQADAQTQQAGNKREHALVHALVVAL